MALLYLRSCHLSMTCHSMIYQPKVDPFMVECREGITATLPSPAGKGDREAVDEESGLQITVLVSAFHHHHFIFVVSNPASRYRYASEYPGIPH